MVPTFTPTPARRRRMAPVPLTLVLALLHGAALAAQEKRPLTFVDLMQIRQIEQPSISADGRWIAFTARPDRGDPEVVVRATAGDARYVIPLGSHPVIGRDGRFMAARVEPSLEARETADEDRAPRRGMAVLDLADGGVTTVDDVESFAFSGDGTWLAYHRYRARDEDQAGASGEGQAAGENGKRKPGTSLVLRNLSSGTEVEVAFVRAYALAEEGARIAYAVADPDNARDGLYVRELGSDAETPVHTAAFGHYADLTWREDGSALAFVAAVENADGEPGTGTLMSWEASGTSTLAGTDDAPDGWFVPVKNTLRWSDDGERLFFGWRPARAHEADTLRAIDEEAARRAAGDTLPAGEGAPATADTTPFAPYDLNAILEDRGVDVWHWMDPHINPQQKILWPREKDRTYTAVYDLDRGRAVALANPDVPDVTIPENASVALAGSDVPYRREFTWMGRQADAYVVKLSDGSRTRIAERLAARASLAPAGSYAVFYERGNYHLYDVESGATRNLTDGLGVPIADEDHDYPNEAPGYGVGGWIEGDRAVLVYDKYDVWVIPTDGGDPWCLTQGRGRREKRIFRVVDTDPKVTAIGAHDDLLLSSYHDLEKSFGFYRARADRPGVARLLEEERRFRFVARAEEGDALLYTREDYDEFPDLWVAKPDFSDAHRVTDVNPRISEFAWGTAELTAWTSDDGIPLQGVIIKPGDYEPGKRYPVLVYYYRFFSQRLHEFNEPAVNHRPSFPLYASNGYVVFLPDVRFEVGRPGLSSTKSVVPGVKHLIDMGIADPDAIALHGHSWSGYQTAFMVTQTDIFRTAIAGAPVANMTSAYSGIRWGSGLARQFQYEKGQSRLSGSLWEARDEYIDNSPVFFADRIHTPMLILHGDEDDAVPWYQSIELYLALRRLGREAVFLEYRGEPHHPRKYPNKLDWAMKMKQWLDYYLKGEPPADWIVKGAPYTGK